MMLVAAVLILPFALVAGGFNGLSLLGVVLALGYITVTLAPTRRHQ